MIIALIVCAALQQPLVAQESFSQSEFKSHEMRSETYLFAAPADFRSAGFWWNDGLCGAEIALIGQDGSMSPWWPLVVQEDLSQSSQGPAGDLQVSALIHGSQMHHSGLMLRTHGSVLPVDFAILWIPSDAHLQPSLSLASTPKPPVFDRSSWGANPAVCSPTYCTTTHVAMHHTASASEYLSQSWSECAANVKASQIYHMVSRGWCDIGYNYLICPHGDVFEGRGGGDDVRGAHDGYNCGSMGVAMMGYFHTPHFQTLNTPMQDAFVNLAAWKCDQQNIDPLGTSWYAGYGGNQLNIYGHRNVTATACPGDLAYAELPQLRQRVEQILQGGSTEIILDNHQASFTGNWTTGTSSSDKYGSDYQWASSGVAIARALWTPSLAQAGDYQISLWWPEGSNRNPSTQVGLLLNGQLLTTTVNQQFQGGQWNVLGVVALPAGASTTIGLSNEGSLGWVVVADALRLVRQ